MHNQLQEDRKHAHCSPMLNHTREHTDGHQGPPQPIPLGGGGPLGGRVHAHCDLSHLQGLNITAAKKRCQTPGALLDCERLQGPVPYAPADLGTWSSNDSQVYSSDSWEHGKGICWRTNCTHFQRQLLQFAKRWVRPSFCLVEVHFLLRSWGFLDARGD